MSRTPLPAGFGEILRWLEGAVAAADLNIARAAHLDAAANIELAVHGTGTRAVQDALGVAFTLRLPAVLYTGAVEVADCARVTFGVALLGAAAVDTASCADLALAVAFVCIGCAAERAIAAANATVVGAISSHSAVLGASVVGTGKTLGGRRCIGHGIHGRGGIDGLQIGIRQACSRHHAPTHFAGPTICAVDLRFAGKGIGSVVEAAAYK